MNFQDFAKSKGISAAAITKYVQANEDLFNGHIKKDGKSKVLDEKAIELLNEHYPEPSAVVVQDEALKAENLLLLKENSEIKSQVIKLLEEKNAAMALLKEAELKLQLIDVNGEKNQALQEENSSLKAELNKIKSLNLIQRLLKKY